jgi:hyperosmotically inducible periplasmic protein
LRIASSSLWIIAAVVALLIGACDGPANEHADSPKLDIPPTTLADRTGDALRIATAADDMAITTRVKAAVLAEPGLKSVDIIIETQNATVTLSGSVDSADLRERAKQIAALTPGVRGVVDQLALKTTS